MEYFIKFLLVAFWFYHLRFVIFKFVAFENIFSNLMLEKQY